MRNCVFVLVLLGQLNSRLSEETHNNLEADFLRAGLLLH